MAGVSNAPLSSAPQVCIALNELSPVSIQTQSLALRALRKRKRKKRKRLRWQAANHGCHCFDRAFLLAGACLRFLRFSFAFEWKPGFKHGVRESETRRCEDKLRS